APPPAEPLLQTIAQEILPRGVSGADLAAIEDGWAALIDGPVDADAVTRHGRERGGHLFAAAATILGRPDARAREAGALWALADLAHGHADAAVRDRAAPQARAIAHVRAPWPIALRPLGMLAVLAARDARDATRRQGHPARLLRMLALRLIGR
uniref:hypothetical protein n=1 Tax=Sphingomonas sp. TaxID=28214 RepID=UPI003B3B40F2